MAGRFERPAARASLSMISSRARVTSAAGGRGGHFESRRSTSLAATSSARGILGPRLSIGQTDDFLVREGAAGVPSMLPLLDKGPEKRGPGRPVDAFLKHQVEDAAT